MSVQYQEKRYLHFFSTNRNVSKLKTKVLLAHDVIGFLLKVGSELVFLIVIDFKLLTEKRCVVGTKSLQIEQELVNRTRESAGNMN